MTEDSVFSNSKLEAGRIDASVDNGIGSGIDGNGGLSSTILSSPTAKMDFLRTQLAAQGHATEGMSFSLLMLEWKYDISVLFGGLGHWMKNLDTRFNGFNEWH